ncbi:MAG: hypothetical protein US03_C0010G0023 [candidate division TM6 bacterium GW2011_GWF2_36_131]|nr:MAG: hypothetical protein US03_C0010G0023 [candidate division TM6 bacterium GW2011_GWF2_36_131]KKQ18141.1 MAG: hypothetical protein US32_C0030G0008 [candidate division TM6 bacterium GW2011_GWA2_36_9]
MHEKRDRDEEPCFFNNIVDESRGRGFTISEDEWPVKRRKSLPSDQRKDKDLEAAVCSYAPGEFGRTGDERVINSSVVNPEELIMLFGALPVPDLESPHKLYSFISAFHVFLNRLGLNVNSMSVFSRLVDSIQDEQRKQKLILDELYGCITLTDWGWFCCPLCEKSLKEEDLIKEHIKAHYETAFASSFDQEKSDEREKQ